MDTPRARERKAARHNARSQRRAASMQRAERRATRASPSVALSPACAVTPWANPRSDNQSAGLHPALWLLPLFLLGYLLFPTPDSSEPGVARAVRPKAGQSQSYVQVPMTQAPRAAIRSLAALTHSAPPAIEPPASPVAATPPAVAVRTRLPVATIIGRIASAAPRLPQSVPGRALIEDAIETGTADQQLTALPAPVEPERKSWVRFSRLTFPPHPRSLAPIEPPDSALIPPPRIAAVPEPLHTAPAANNAAHAALCSAPASLSLSGLRRAPSPPGSMAGLDQVALGRKISEAALAQINDLVVYRAAYSRIAFPMGDVSPMFGVCTDVVIRALREVGIDLQEQVQRTRTGNGDTNIDHRRVDTLKRYFALHGESAPISEFAEDYHPGDIVTYFRPWNRSTTTHIAVVSHMIAPSGRPMIVHNRGWGAQLEDALLVDRITGHYRVLTAALAAAPPVTARTPVQRSGNQANAQNGSPTGSLTGSQTGPLTIRHLPSATTTAARAGG